jgi:hypothetical protein
MSSLSVVFLVVQWIAGALAVGRWLAWKREAQEEARHSLFLRGVMRDQLRETQVARERADRLEAAARSAGAVLAPVVDTPSAFVVTPGMQSVPGRKGE